MAESTLLVHFISDFLRDTKLRCAVLENEEIGLAEYGLNDKQAEVLLTFETPKILKFIEDELRGLGIDMEKKKEEMPAAILASSNFYQAGDVHPRKVVPHTIKVNQSCRLTLCGNGFDQYTQVRFTIGIVPDAVVARVVSSHCDVDLYQRIELEAELPLEGEWIVQVRTPELDWKAGDTPVILHVTA